MKFICDEFQVWYYKGRSPRGERGLKSFPIGGAICGMLSLPPRGAWIEMRLLLVSRSQSIRRSPRGERGLKYPCRD